jgi:hypothetical protein
VKKSALITAEKKDENPILIVDRLGTIGDALIEQLKDESLIVFVSQKKPSSPENVVYIPFFKKNPTVPDNTYSHIFVVDDGTGATKDSLSSFIKKAQYDRAIFLFATHVSRTNERFVSEIQGLYQKAKIAVFGDIFCKDIIYDTKFTVNKFIYQAQSYSKIDVPGDGTGISYPVFLEDVVEGIFEAVFGAGENKNLFYLFPKHAVMSISLAHMMQKTNPALHIDFIKEKKTNQGNYVFSTEGVYLLGENYALEDRIKEIDFKEKKTLETVAVTSSPYKEEKNIVLPFFWLIICIAFFLFLPLITVLGFSFLGLESLKNTKSSLDKGDFIAAGKSIYSANYSFSFAQNAMVILSSESQIFGRQDLLNKLEANVETGKNVSTAGTYLINASKSLTQAFSGNTNSTSSFIEASNYLKNAIVIFEKEKAQGENLSDITQQIDPLINFVSNTIDVWPDLLGFNNKKTYLVLFQNNMELRPGGGFIGSYGLLSLDKGKITDFSIHDVYDADGQLTGHVEPPFAIRRYLQSTNLYMRDSNFDVDYINDAAITARFLSLEKKQQVNGVIAVDVSFVKNILSAMGQIYVPEYNENVNSDNLFQLTESHAEKNFFPGSTQKKDFLRLLLQSMENNIASNKNISYLYLAQAVGDSISQKHVLFAFDNSSIQNLFTVNGWSSSLWDDRKDDKNLVNDYFGINEANLGINKANYFIKRSVSQIVNIDDNGGISSSITVAYKNTNVNGIWPGGNYKNYLRFILPQGAQMTSIKINGQIQSTIAAITDPQIYENKNFSPPSKLEIEKYDQNGKTIYGFLTNVPITALQTITFNYSLSNQVLVSSSVLNYDLRIFKQPGTDEYPYDFSITYPNVFRVIYTSDGADNNGRVVYSGNLNKDKDISINFAKK